LNDIDEFAESFVMKQQCIRGFDYTVNKKQQIKWGNTFELIELTITKSPILGVGIILLS
jgi:hypothetical protein